MFNSFKKALVIVLLISVLAFSLFLTYYFKDVFADIINEPENFRMWIDKTGFFGMIAYVLMVAVQVLLAIIPGEPLEIAGGYAFGPIWGTILCLAGATLGSMVVYVAVKKLGMRIIRLFFSQDKIDSLKFLKDSPKRNIIFMILFIIPGTPKDLLCYFIGLTDMSFFTMLLICSLGRIPSVVSSTIGGDALGTQNYMYAVIVFVITAFISMCGILVYNNICKKHHK